MEVGYLQMTKDTRRQHKIRSTGTEDTGACKPPECGCWGPDLVPVKSSKHSYPLGPLSSPIDGILIGDTSLFQSATLKDKS